MDVYGCVSIWMGAYTDACVYGWVRIQMYVYMDACVHARVCTCMYVHQIQIELCAYMAGWSVQVGVCRLECAGLSVQEGRQGEWLVDCVPRVLCI